MSPLSKETELWSKAAKWSVLLLGIALLASSRTAAAQSREAATSPDALHRLNDSIEALVQRVSPAVVQIIVTGYGSTQQNESGQTSMVIGRQRAIGSGVIVDPEGYIVTNAHVLNGAQKIEVFVPPKPAAEGAPASDETGQGKKLRRAHRRDYNGNRSRRDQDRGPRLAFVAHSQTHSP